MLLPAYLIQQQIKNTAKHRQYVILVEASSCGTFRWTQILSVKYSASLTEQTLSHVFHYLQLLDKNNCFKY